MSYLNALLFGVYPYIAGFPRHRHLGQRQAVAGHRRWRYFRDHLLYRPDPPDPALSGGAAALRLFDSPLAWRR